MCSRGREQKRDYLRYAKSGEAKVRVEVFLKKAHMHTSATAMWHLLALVSCWVGPAEELGKGERIRGGRSWVL